MQHGQHIDSSSVAAVDPDHVDALLASELNDMTIGERETVYEQIHGVERKLVETAKSRSEALQEMDDKFKSDGVGCRYLFYRRALQENPSYTKDPALWLMFLRAELFDVSSAAIRLEKFLEAKVEFFGASSIARPITIAQDFDADDLKWLESGIQQILPARDRSGRAIMADFNMVSMQDMQPKKIESLIKTVAYLAMSAAEDEETQKRGMVGIFYFTNQMETVQRLFTRNVKIFDWIPLRMVGGHFCYPPPDKASLKLLNACLLLIVGRDRRVRVRMHEGSHTECQYKLMSFGVPIQNTFPVTCEGVLKTAAHAKWLTRRRAREAAFLKSGRHTSSSTSAQSSLDFPGIELPTAEDILLGRGKMNQDHVGNVWMRSVIQDYLPLYRATPKREKGKVLFQVVQHIQGQGGRFLKRDDAHGGWWVPVTDEVAREKISMAFRTSNSSSNNPTRHSESGPRAVPVRGTTVSSTSTSEVGPGSKRFRRDGGESPNSGSVGSVLPVVASFSTHNHFTFPPQPQQPPLLAPIQQHPQQQGQTQGEQSPFLGFFQRM